MESSIKKIHQEIEILKQKNDFIAIDNLLAGVNEKLSFVLLVSFLSATFSCKEKLKAREKIFILAEQKGIRKYGKEKFDKTIFKNLR